MLKAQLARAFQAPKASRAAEGLKLLRELDEHDEPTEPGILASGSTTQLAQAQERQHRDCDRVIAMLRARLASR